MAISVQPLVVNYSFAGAAAQATDKVDLAQLDAVLQQVTDKLNEIIASQNITLRDDNTLRDGVLEPRMMTDDFRAELSSMVNQRVDSGA